MVDDALPINVDLDASQAREVPKKASDDDGGLPKEYALNFAAKIAERSNEFVSAYELRSPEHTNLYGLVYTRFFPLRENVIYAMKQEQPLNAVHVFASGKTTTPENNEEVFVIILGKPKGISLTELVQKNGPYKEKEVARLFLQQLVDLTAPFSRIGLAHGRINPDRIYFDETTSRLCLDEAISGYCGYYQDPLYEDLDDLLADRSGKGDYNAASDYFAIGMVVLFLLTGKKLFQNKQRDAVLEWRLENGSNSAVIAQMLAGGEVTIGHRTDVLLKSLLSDDGEKRWGAEEISGWLNMEEVMAPATKVHQETSTHFSFNNTDYHSIKRLTHHLHKHWTVAQRSLRMGELSRWLSIAVKRPDLAEIIEALAPDDNQKSVLSDEKLARVIVALDPTGPIRFQSFSANIYGFGSFLVDVYRQENQNKLQHFAAVINNGVMNYWIAKQDDPELFNVVNLGWSHIRARRIIRKQGLGFGMERMIYELNSALPCQSKLLYPYYALTVPEAFLALEKHSDTDHSETDPIDRHIAAFFAHKIGLNEEITIRPMSAYPKISKNQYIITLGLYTVAKRQFSIPALPNLTKWIYSKIDTIHDDMHSQSIRADLKKELAVSVKKGALDQLFGALVSPLYIKKDKIGFEMAQKRYLTLDHTIRELTGGNSARKVAYRIGLKLSAYIAYSVLALTIFYAIFSS